LIAPASILEMSSSSLNNVSSEWTDALMLLTPSRISGSRIFSDRAAAKQAHGVQRLSQNRGSLRRRTVCAHASLPPPPDRACSATCVCGREAALISSTFAKRLCSDSVSSLFRLTSEREQGDQPQRRTRPR
jgi:hypothetical protein